MTRRTLGLLVLMLFVGSGIGVSGGAGIDAGGGIEGVSTAGADTEYVLSMASSVDVEPQTVTLEGTDYTFTEIGKTTAESEFDVTADVPGGSEYSIYIYNKDEQIQDTQRMEGSGTATFDAGSFDPGTYLLAINGPDGGTRAVMPLVVTGYEVAQSHPSTATPGENVTINVDVSRTDSDAEATSRVSIVITYDGEEREVTAERITDGEYEATVTLEEKGEYAVYTGVHGESEIDGEKQLVGISEQSTISVADDTGDGNDDDTGDSNGGTGDADGDSTETATTTETRTPTPTETATEAPTETVTSTATETRTDTVIRETDTATSSTSTTTAPSSGPITPGGDTPEPEPVSVPMNGVRNLLVLLVLVSAFARLDGPR